ncbi:AraC family transcriptional regulator [Chitinophaga sp. XS-30]|uniref:helix-turn-helix domain-containing protein n=1 Tax=Chitinophaga sp. XS-30 TaxID=2604421 RepID=UPI0011DE2BE1|nr:AraC family transcriptional regulator [Chitinophaga sp. XS-30]QEH43452.1 helix-turn-helix transcriptional regulator [Chitinophaga sp. XS-30]
MNNQIISYNNNRIILSHEREKKVILDIYPSNHLLTYIREGMLKVKQGNAGNCFKKGEFVLFKKYTPATITKTWDNGDLKFSSIVFTFQEDIVTDALHHLRYPSAANQGPLSENIIGIAPNPVLNHFIRSLQPFFEAELEMDSQLARLKTTEALIGVIQADAALAHQLAHFSVKSNADLFQYMNFHYLENKPLAEFARGSGRSISAFKKDFRSTFNTTPAKWLKNRRLEHAYRLLSTTRRKASEVYIESGFEDLAHFSKSFKSQFGVNPSTLSKSLQTSK